MGSADRPLRSPRLWVVDPNRPAAGLAVAAAAFTLGEAAIYWNPDQQGGWIEAGKVLEAQAADVAEIWVAGPVSDLGRWLLESTVSGPELPGGGRTMFPDRRLVAFYGATSTSRLGVLGEQGPQETLERLQPYLGEYTADGTMTIPTFEIIATLATGAAGEDGNYSGEFSIETLMPWVDFAGQNGVYVVLDLQPGRTDFLTQAKQYEGTSQTSPCGTGPRSGVEAGSQRSASGADRVGGRPGGQRRYRVAGSAGQRREAASETADGSPVQVLHVSQPRAYNHSSRVGSRHPHGWSGFPGIQIQHLGSIGGGYRGSRVVLGMEELLR